jgi:hypothetical protein
MRKTMAVLMGLALVAGLLGTGEALAAVQQPFTLQPGGVATITFEAYCTEFGKFFPQSIVAPTGELAPDKIRAALAYIDQQGYSADQAKALEANYAIWQLAGAQRLPAPGATTQEVVQNATAAPADPAGTSLLDAAAAGQVKLTLTGWAPIGPKVQILSATDNFYGRGTITVENVSTGELSLYMPVGTVFPGSEARFQKMGGFATQIDVQNPNLPSTGAGSAPPAWFIALVAIGLLLAGRLVTRQARSS